MLKLTTISLIVCAIFSCQTPIQEEKNAETTENTISFEDIEVYKIQIVKFADKEVLWSDTINIGEKSFIIDSSKFEFENDIVQLQIFPTSKSQVNIVIPFSKYGSNKIVIKKLDLEDESVSYSIRAKEFKVGFIFSGNEYLKLYEGFLDNFYLNNFLGEEKEVDTNEVMKNYLDGLGEFVKASRKSQIGAYLVMTIKSFIQSREGASESKVLMSKINKISYGGKGLYESTSPSFVFGGYNEKCIDYPIDTLVFQSKNSIVQFEKDHVIVIDFWATWCKPCVVALKYLDSLKATQFKNENVTFVAVSIDDDLIKARTFLLDITENLYSYFDSGGCMKDIYDITSVPQVFIYDKNRKLRYANVPKDSIAYYVNLLLEK